jgi:hypothetical protein
MILFALDFLRRSFRQRRERNRRRREAARFRLRFNFNVIRKLYLRGGRGKS